MARVNIVGDGPGGLSAALFLAKNGHEVTVYGQDETAMNFAYLHNYLGIPEIAGTEFQSIARSLGVDQDDSGAISVDPNLHVVHRQGLRRGPIGETYPEPGDHLRRRRGGGRPRHPRPGGGQDVQDWDTPPKD